MNFDVPGPVHDVILNDYGLLRNWARVPKDIGTIDYYILDINRV